ncbi:MAG: ATP-binding protein [Kofleriaceae bacterium]|nr:ATP-binding protein [Kofleriaceae bacterium]MCL4224694.1 ATP-binding protein [Myxococcales bacterium]
MAGTNPGGPSRPRTVRDRLSAARARTVYGREDERAQVAQALAAAEPPWIVLHVVGPGGVGKSTLLAAIAEDARAQGIGVIAADLRHVDGRPDLLLDHLRAQAGVADEAALQAWLGAARRLVLLDTFELAGSVDAWLRAVWLPGLPDTVLVVTAGRLLPAAAWRDDPAWTTLARTLPLRNLGPPDAIAMLDGHGVRRELIDPIVEVTHGHPLALALFASTAGDAACTSASVASLRDAPDVLAELVARLTDRVPSPRHLAALQVAAHVRTTTEDVLDAVLRDADAAALFAWLSTLSFVTPGPHGLVVHDLVRDVLDAGLAWRDPAAYHRMHRRVRAYLAHRLEACGAAEAYRFVRDVIWTDRYDPSLRSLMDWSQLNAAIATPLVATDVEVLVGFVHRHEGARSAELARRWLTRQPAGAMVARRGDGRPQGYAHLIELGLVDDEDVAADPVVAHAVAWLARHAPAAGPRVAVMQRFFTDAEAHMAPATSSFAVGAIHSVDTWVRRRDLGWFLWYFHHPRDGEIMAYARQARLPALDVTVDHLRYRMYGRDFSTGDWLREAPPVTGMPAPPGGSADREASALSRPEFEAAVAQALRDLGRPERLAHSALLTTRFGLALEPPRVDALAALLTRLIRELAEDPRDGRLGRALDRTYVRAAPSQELAAELLGVGVSSLRRHLRAGTDRLVEQLWFRETGG